MHEGGQSLLDARLLYRVASECFEAALPPSIRMLTMHSQWQILHAPVLQKRYLPRFPASRQLNRHLPLNADYGECFGARGDAVGTIGFELKQVRQSPSIHREQGAAPGKRDKF